MLAARHVPKHRQLCGITQEVFSGTPLLGFVIPWSKMLEFKRAASGGNGHHQVVASNSMLRTCAPASSVARSVPELNRRKSSTHEDAPRSQFWLRNFINHYFSRSHVFQNRFHKCLTLGSLKLISK